MTCTRCRTTLCRCGSGCNVCRANPCSCSNLVPFYDDVPSCEEDHCERIYVNQFSFAVCAEDSWNVPACGQTAVLSVPGVRGITVGAYLWHPNYGYFEIQQLNSKNGTIGIVNPCFDGNASPGTQIPKCTCFTVTDLPSDIASQSGIFVAFDFTAPAEGNCIDITLTSTASLVEGNLIQIGTGVYLLSEVKANNVVTICNEGEGIIAGTPVVAQNVSGQYQYPVTQIGVNPCTQDPVTSGSVLVCDELSAKKITGTTIGDVLTLDDPVTGEASYQTIVFPTPDISSGVISDVSVNNIGTIDGNAGPLSINTNNAQIIIINPSATFTENVFVTFEAYIVGEASQGDSAPGEFSLQLFVDTGSGATLHKIVTRPFNTQDDGNYGFADQVTDTKVYTIPPSGSLTITVAGTVLVNGSGPGLEFTTFQAKVSAIGVAV